MRILPTKKRSRRLSFRCKTGYFCGVLFLFGVGAGIASPLVLQEGVANEFSEGATYHGTSDTYLFEPEEAANFGGLKALAVDSMPAASGHRQHSALLRFDVAALAGKTITAPATLSLVQVNAVGETGDASFAFNVYAVSAKNADWNQGTGKGTEASEGEATWKCKAAPGTPWAGSPGLSEPGTDYEAKPIATLDYRVADGTGHVVRFAVPAALIRQWADHPETNGGLLFVWQSGGRVPGLFRSSKWGVLAQRPSLEIDLAP